MQNEPIQATAARKPSARIEGPDSVPTSRVPVALWRKLLAVPMFLLTVVFGIGAGMVLALTLLSMAAGAPFLEWRPIDESGGLHVLGWGFGAAVGAFLVALASIQNRVRRRTLIPRPKAPRGRAAP